ncbi:class 1 fructose-bisphosphatase [Pseudonocardia adelaidensis]|uniref:Fructose-1,6-bisphosphatase class 1 n=1 Tax=Pseudonocardia adelaidensis TaxID=648754 RepID=A0ABP9NBA4_9PSEU
MLAARTTLAQFLIDERRRHPAARPELESLLLDVALACKEVAERVALGSLRPPVSSAGRSNVHGEVQHELDLVANDRFLRATERGGRLAGMVSEELDEPHLPPAQHPRGDHLLVFDPLDGSSNIDVNVSVGSIFSILRAPRPGVDAATQDFLQPGTAQVGAGYALYGPATMLVLTLGRGVHAFTLDPALGEFVLTREALRVPRQAAEFAINASNRRFWEPAVRRYVDECLAGLSGPRHKDFTMRWIASLVAEAHRILTRGGVFLYPRDTKDPARPGRLRLLYEANPIAFLVEQAGGAASTGRERILDVEPSGLHQRIPLIFGAADEVALIDRFHRQHNDRRHDSPLYGERGLFRVAT